MSLRWLAIFFAVVLTVRTLHGEKILSDQATAALWTVGPNEELYAAFGHSALRITDPLIGFDRIYNFGTFDFSTPNFYLKFIRGDLDYFLTAAIAPELLEEYRDKKQLVVEQQLNLTAAELDALFLNMEDNLQPENASYRYDFVRDNCTTRIRDAVAKVVHIEWKTPTPIQPTLREMVQPYVADRPAIQTGINLLFGSTVDYSASTQEAMFLPYAMKVTFDAAQIVDAGGSRKLVRQTKNLLTGPLLPSHGINWLIPFSYLTALLAAIGTWRHWQWFRAVDILAFCIAGLIGCLLIFLQFGTRHWVLHENWNLLWAWPTHLLIWFFPKKLQRWYWLLAAFCTICSLFLTHIAVLGFLILLIIRAVHLARIRC